MQGCIRSPAIKPGRSHPHPFLRRFHIVGGECNYLLHCSPWPECALAFVPEADWKSAFMLSWREDAIQALLSDAVAVLLQTAKELRLPVKVGQSGRLLAA